ncbi:hypothetical protein ANN_11606 [Periplaneta americana]|uniref:Uncharacterized protein n=1 Tax=Periplaneta americana TaxID=6978 RepID=A0ABQ8T5H4_PERAM|nr:hypothetical protein ANN_11606 [Periplaneta americana]
MAGLCEGGNEPPGSSMVSPQKQIQVRKGQFAGARVKGVKSNCKGLGGSGGQVCIPGGPHHIMELPPRDSPELGFQPAGGGGRSAGESQAVYRLYLNFTKSASSSALDQHFNPSRLASSLSISALLYFTTIISFHFEEK